MKTILRTWQTLFLSSSERAFDQHRREIKGKQHQLERPRRSLIIPGLKKIGGAEFSSIGRLFRCSFGRDQKVGCPAVCDTAILP